MEEWEVAEEEQGFEEPVTIKNELGTVTYQFNPGVHYVTDNVQEYLVQVDHDTILYFMDNLPEEWTPLPGNLLAAGCSHKIPYGLNHRVLSVENVGGLYKVVCTKAAIEEVYKELSYCFDTGLSYPTGIETLDSVQLAALGYEKRDSVIMDWHTYDSMKGIKAATRADDENEEKPEEIKVEQGETTTQTVFIDWTLDTRDIVSAVVGVGKSNEAYKNFEQAIANRLEEERKEKEKKLGGKILGNITPYAAYSLKVTHYISAHSERNQAQEYQCDYTDTWTEIEAKVQKGVEYKKTSGQNVTAKGIGTDPQTYNTGLHEWIQLTTTAGYKDVRADLVPNPKQSWTNAIIRFVFWAGPVPAAFILTSNLNPELSIGGSICVSGSLITAKHRTGKIVRNGITEDLNKDIEEATIKFNSVTLDGHFKVGANFRAAAGFEVAGALAITIGANVDAFLEGEGQIKVMDGSLPPGELFCFSPSGLVKFYVDLYGDIQLHVQPLGIHIWDKQLAKFLTTRIAYFSTKLEPDIWYVNGHCANTDDFGIGTGFFRFKDLGGVNSLIRNGTYHPGMRMYMGPIKDGKYWQMVKDDDEVQGVEYGGAEIEKTYYFKAKGMMEPDITEVHFVPTLYLLDQFGEVKKEVVCDQAEQKVEVGNPIIKTEMTYQTYGGRNSYDFSGQAPNGVAYVEGGNGNDEGGGQSIDASTLNKFKFMGRFFVTNGSHIKKWGVKVHVYNGKGDVILRRRVPINKFASGVYTIVISFLSNWEPSYATMNGNEGKLSYRVTPYWDYEDEYTGASVSKEADDFWSKRKVTLDYPVDDISPTNDGKHDSGQWGEILPEKEI